MPNLKLSGRTLQGALAGTGAATLSLAATLLFASAGHADVKPQTLGVCNSCSCSHQDLDGRDSYLTDNSTLRSGPSGDCGFVSNETSGNTYFELYCYVVNKYGNTWSYGHIKGTSRYGWIWDAHLWQDGSDKPCSE